MTAKQAALNLVFFPVFVLGTLVLIPALAVIVLCQAPFLSRRARLRLLRRTISWYGDVVVSLPAPGVPVRSREHAPIPPRPCLFISNHQAVNDPFLHGEVAARVHFCVQPLAVPSPRSIGFFAQLAGYLDIESMSVADFLAAAGQLFREGVSIISFPEGTGTKTGAIGPFHTMLFRVAVEERVPIVPICIQGNDRVFPRGKQLSSGPGGRASAAGARMGRLPWVDPHPDCNKVRSLIVKQASESNPVTK